MLGEVFLYSPLSVRYNNYRFFFFFLSVNENDMMVVMLKNRGFLDKKKKTSIYLRKYENLGSVGLIRFFFVSRTAKQNNGSDSEEKSLS